MTDDAAERYRTDRLAALFCGDPTDANCRHEWNRQHPDDPVTAADQDAFMAGFEPDPPRRVSE